MEENQTLRRLIMVNVYNSFVELNSRGGFKLHRRRNSIARNLILLTFVAAHGCARTIKSEPPGDSPRQPSTGYTWTKVTDHAGFPEAYNFPIFNFRNTLWAFHSQGNWFSKDGKSCTKAELPALGLRTGYQQYVQIQRRDLRAQNDGRRLSEFENGLSHYEND